MRAVRIATAALASAVILIAAGCGDDNGTAPSRPTLRMADLIGTWEATNIVAANRSDPSEAVDLFALGAFVNVKFEADHDIAFVSDFEGDLEASTGSVTIGDGHLHVVGDGTQSSEEIGCGYSQDRLTITFDADTYDFDEDGTQEPARITIVFVRCADEIAVSDTHGEWVATKSEVTNDDDPSESVDLVSLGNEASATIEDDGRYTLRLTEVGEPTETQIGRLRAVGKYLVALDDADPGHPVAFGCEIDIMTLTLLQTDVTYDFDDDGTEEEASATIELVRE